MFFKYLLLRSFGRPQKPWTPFDQVVALAFCCKLEFEEVSVLDCMTDKLEEVNCLRFWFWKTFLGTLRGSRENPRGTGVQCRGGFCNPEYSKYTRLVQLQGDPNQNSPFQMAITLKLSTFDPTLVKHKCI